MTTGKRDEGSPALQALSGILEAATAQIHRLRDGAARPDVDRGGLAESALGLLLEGVAAHVAPLRHDSTQPGDVRRKATAFCRDVETYRAASLPVGRYLDDLASDWACGRCNERVAKAAAVSGVRLDAIELSLVCAACGEKTRVTGKNFALFEKIFGHVVSPQWNPRANGFLWDGR